MTNDEMTDYDDRWPMKLVSKRHVLPPSLVGDSQWNQWLQQTRTTADVNPMINDEMTDDRDR